MIGIIVWAILIFVIACVAIPGFLTFLLKLFFIVAVVWVIGAWVVSKSRK